MNIETKTNCILVLLLFGVFNFSFGIKTNAQQSSKNDSINFGGYLETYYLYDFANPQNHERPSFAYSHNRHNEVNLNLGLIKGTYRTRKVRANLGIMTGTYANANLSHEPGVLKNIFESNVGIKISKNKNVWVDAGVFPSHIGFESAIGMDCWNLTRSILADNSPYYESGVKISYTSADSTWFVSGLYLNGWQRMQRAAGNNTPSFGHQITFKPNTKLTLNSSSFIGNLYPDEMRKMRYFHNFYAQYNPSAEIGFILGLDIGAEQKTPKNSVYHAWYSPVLIAKIKLTEKINCALRLEHYNDRHKIVINTNANKAFETYGYSINFDYRIEENVLWRIEARGFDATERVFLKNEREVYSNYFVSTSLAIKIGAI